MIDSRWDFGDEVRVVRNVRNDGTYPGKGTGCLLVKRGSVGTVVDIGTFLQDQIIYSVHFLDIDRIVGCREEELIDIADEWTPSLYETRERVAVTLALAVRGEVLVPTGSIGEILKVIRDEQAGVIYHIHFDCLPGRPLGVPEASLRPVAGYVAARQSDGVAHG